MKRSLIAAFAALVLLTPADASSACVPGAGEEFHYSWRLRGGLSWIASLKFPTSGRGYLLNSPQTGTPATFASELKITAANPSEGYYLYQSQIAQADLTTLMTYHGYAFGGSKRHERTLFDYVKRLARIRKETTDEVENRVKPIPAKGLRDVLTGIHYLRMKSGEIVHPLPAEIYSDGRLYQVVFRPIGTQLLQFQGVKVRARGYQIVAAAENAKKRWPGGVQVWLSDDERKMPVRIEIQRPFANLQLDLESVGSCSSVATLKR